MATSTVFLVACGAAPADSGTTAFLRVHEGEFHPGDVPAESGGPAVTGIDNAQYAVWRGQVGKPFGGSLAASATSALLALDGDTGYWIVTAGVPDITAPDQPTFHATLDFSLLVPLGPRKLVVRAADPAGRVGPAYDEPLMFYDLPPPDGALVVTLAWDTEADLDLHVVTPAGVEIWAGQPFESSFTTGEPPAADVGYLDLDSNAACVIDGRRQENVIWKQDPPHGHYVVRVDTASLCAASRANWSVAARLAGHLLARSIGQSDPASTRVSNARGAGIVALEFDVP